jgi:hypothetical protein
MRWYHPINVRPRRRARTRRAVGPTVELLDELSVPSLVRPMMSALAPFVVGRGHPSPVRREAMEAAGTRREHAERARMMASPTAPGNLGRGSRLAATKDDSDSGDGGSSTDDSDSGDPDDCLFEADDHDSGLSRKFEVEVNLASSNDPDLSSRPLPGPRHAPRSLLADERGDADTAVTGPQPRVATARQARVVIGHRRRPTLAQNRAALLAVDELGTGELPSGSSRRIEPDGSATAACAQGLQHASAAARRHAAARPMITALRTWGLVLARMACAPALTERLGTRAKEEPEVS